MITQHDNALMSVAELVEHRYLGTGIRSRANSAVEMVVFGLASKRPRSASHGAKQLTGSLGGGAQTRATADLSNLMLIFTKMCRGRCR